MKGHEFIHLSAALDSLRMSTFLWNIAQATERDWVIARGWPWPDLAIE
jgi:hypothetical protein